MSYLSYKFDRQETIRDQAKMNLASHHAWRLSRNYFEACKPDKLFAQKAMWYNMNTYLINQGLEEGGWDLKSGVKFPYIHESHFLLESFHESRD